MIPHMLTYPIPEPARGGSPTRVAAGVHWLRLALPYRLDHINVWLLEEDEGWTLVDTGLGSRASLQQWRELFRTVLRGIRIRRIVVTHYHVDHLGAAAQLAAERGLPVLMTATEYRMAGILHERTEAQTTAVRVEQFHRHGLDMSRIRAVRDAGDHYRSMVPGLPAVDTFLADGDTLRIGGRDWRVITVGGHSPEQACLYSAADGLLIAGDQLLPDINSNVSLRPELGEENPLGDYLASLDRLADLPRQTLVLPSHGVVYFGLHRRMAGIVAHRRRQHVRLLQACAEPRSAADLLRVLYRREPDAFTLGLAMGEMMAHLAYLHHRGALELVSDAPLRYRVRSGYPGWNEIADGDWFDSPSH